MLKGFTTASMFRAENHHDTQLGRSKKLLSLPCPLQSLVVHPLLCPLEWSSLFSAFIPEEKAREQRRSSSLCSNQVLHCLLHGSSVMPCLFKGKAEALGIMDMALILF